VGLTAASTHLFVLSLSRGGGDNDGCGLIHYLVEWKTAWHRTTDRRFFSRACLGSCLAECF
jgi:hypothetical protein